MECTGPSRREAVARSAETADALRLLAVHLRGRASVALGLDRAPDEVVEEGRIEQIAIRTLVNDERVVLRHAGTVLEITGSSSAMGKLGQALENLAESAQRIDDLVRPHIDLEYFPGHGFLDADSTWVTVFLIGAS